MTRSFLPLALGQRDRCTLWSSCNELTGQPQPSRGCHPGGWATRAAVYLAIPRSRHCAPTPEALLRARASAVSVVLAASGLLVGVANADPASPSLRAATTAATTATPRQALPLPPPNP